MGVVRESYFPYVDRTKPISNDGDAPFYEGGLAIELLGEVSGDEVA